MLSKHLHKHLKANILKSLKWKMLEILNQVFSINLVKFIGSMHVFSNVEQTILMAFHAFDRLLHLAMGYL